MSYLTSDIHRLKPEYLQDFLEATREKDIHNPNRG
jgi:hypothetical protein